MKNYAIVRETKIIILLGVKIGACYKLPLGLAVCYGPRESGSFITAV
jgi:hypothetical protein